LWLYATVEGVGSARAIERLCDQHDAYRWICGGVPVNHHSLSDFRVRKVDSLDRVLTESVAVLMDSGVVQLQRVAQDGVRVRANAGAASFRRQTSLQRCLRDPARGAGGAVLSLVMDASAVAEYLLRTPAGERVERTIRTAGSDLHTPALCDVEVAAALRKGLLSGRLGSRRAAEALEDYFDLPLIRHGHQLLVERALELRDNFSAYDAIYTALAERLGATLVTADERLAKAVRTHLAIGVL
jgi:predicted nucleic acid-binding protein